MKWNEQTQQEAQQLVETLTESQWNALKTAVPALLKPSTPEQVKAQEERREQARVQQEAAKADFEEKRSTFKAWAEKKLKGLKMPTAYDFSIGDIEPLCEYALHAEAGHEGFYDTISFMYDYGFKRGINCQKAKVQKRKNQA